MLAFSKLISLEWDLYSNASIKESTRDRRDAGRRIFLNEVKILVRKISKLNNSSSLVLAMICSRSSSRKLGVFKKISK
ncbi:MAG: hypothetical protein KTM48_00650, partial [Wolbachia endosymbiont of Pissodes strobi]|nr:hypothetical protein [Wolbachia endosymbiont of Pissodes strobi]